MKKFIMIVAILIVMVAAVVAICVYDAPDEASFDDKYKSQTVMEDFYALEDNTIDMVCIGNSSVQRGLVNPYAWKEYGASIYSIATSSEPFGLTPCLIKEAEKTQDPDTYIIDFRNAIEPGRTIKERDIRRVTDNMQLSSNRTKGLDTVLSYAASDGNEEVDKADQSYYDPTLKYSGQKAEKIKYDNITYYNGFTYFPYFAFTVTPEANDGGFTTETQAIEPAALDQLNEILDYCDTLVKKGKNVLFVVSPYAASAGDKEKLNYVQNIMEERGYTVLNFLHEDLSEAAGIDYDTSFYNKGHMNLKAASIWTDYMMKYIKKNYGIKDRRGEDKYSSWNSRVEKFYHNARIADTI